MSTIVLIFLMAANVLANHQNQPGYEVCAMMMDGAERVRCLEVVRGATRRYPKEVVEICTKIKDDSFKSRVLLTTRDRVFPSGALEVCQPLASDDSMTQLMRCLTSAGDVQTRWKKSYSEEGYLEKRNWDEWERLYAAMEHSAQQGCQGWEYYAFSNKNWRRDDCWWTAQQTAEWGVDLRTVVRKTSGGRAYTTWDAVPVLRNVTYYLYHCRTNYCCWRWVKDFSEVQ